MHRSFPDSTLRGNAEFGDSNQVEVALVMYLSGQGIISGKNTVAAWVNNLRLRVQYITLVVQSMDYRLDTDQD